MLQTLAPNDSFWDKDFLAGDFPTDDPAQIQFDDHEDPRLHLLTYFSGRDGFRATVISLSAPLELLQSCNSISWTLLTITHEISHILVDGVLAFLLPKPHTEADLNAAIELLVRGENCATLFEQMQQLLCYSIWQIASPNATDWLEPQTLGLHLEQHGQSLYEIVTHCFDFLYFYRADPAVYIPAVWASWSAIPNIENRVSEYIVRSLCALLTNHLRRENGVQVAIDQLLHLLENAEVDFPDAQYVPQAINELKSRRSDYTSALSIRRPLALFARHFLYSHTIAQQLLSPETTADFQPLRFTGDTVANPLRFIHDFSRDAAPSHLRSAWLLQQLAFGGEI